MVVALVNTNRMAPAIGPVGLDYVAGAAEAAGLEVDVVDLGLAEDAEACLEGYFGSREAALVGVSLRNADDCFWPSAAWFVPELSAMVRRLRGMTGAPIVLGGVGFSIFAERIVAETGADYGIRGDGEGALVALGRALETGGRLEKVPGLVWREGERVRANPPAWPEPLKLPTARAWVDNAAYFRLGGQGGVETKRGCDRPCTFCADPLAKGRRLRVRDPGEVADEVEALARQGVDVLHVCDGEFNVPVEHARAVCDEFVRRGLGERVRWYTYMALVPFDAALAALMRRAGCLGIDFTTDAACPTMLAAYRHAWGTEDIGRAARLCREHGITSMFDLLLGGPGETPETVAATIGFMKGTAADAVGAALGLRIYPGTAAAEIVASEGPMETNRAIRRRYDGPVDCFRPTFYIAEALGEAPGRLVRELVGGDERFFEPSEGMDASAEELARPTGYNYNANRLLVEAVAAGARGAYWDILRRLRAGERFGGEKGKAR